MQWIIKPFYDLTLDELYAILKLRAEVFVVEQTCIYNDIDDLDKKGIHVFAVDGDAIAGYARVLPANTRFKTPSIGRVVTNKVNRSMGIGAELMTKSIELIKTTWAEELITISAQEHLEKFYNSLGFVRASEVYMEDGIPHIKMTYSGK